MKFRKIYIELSDICGLKCSFCPLPKNIRGVMPITLFEVCLKEAKKYTNLITYHILGDPLSISNIDDYLALTKQYKLQVELTTSGIYLDNFDNLLRSPIRQINISIDAILDLKSNPLVYRYLNRVFEFCHFKETLDSNTFLNLRIQDIKKNEAFIKYIGSVFNINIKDKITQIGKKSRVILKNNFTWINKDFNSGYKQYHGFCYALISHIGILSNGDVIPCCIDAGGNMVLGNIKLNSISEIMQTSRARNMKEGFRNNFLSEDMCRVCDYRNRFNL